MSAYDAAASTFDRHRSLPHGVPETLRSAILTAVEAPSRPRLLDLGAGTGRIGWPFIRAGDDYVGVDLSLGMLREFARRSREGSRQAPRLVQADGEHLPFANDTFDLVYSMIVLQHMPQDLQRGYVTEFFRVLHPGGVAMLAVPEGPDAGHTGWHLSMYCVPQATVGQGGRPDVEDETVLGRLLHHSTRERQADGVVGLWGPRSVVERVTHTGPRLGRTGSEEAVFAPCRRAVSDSLEDADAVVAATAHGPGEGLADRVLSVVERRPCAHAGELTGTYRYGIER